MGMRWSLAPLTLVISLGCNQPAQAPQTPTAPTYSVVGDWTCTSASSKGYTEGLSFNDKGQFARWGNEAEGGWKVGGTYLVKDNKVQFECKEDSPWTYGVKEFSKKGEALITWTSKDEFTLKGPNKTDSFKRLVPTPR